MVKTDCTNALPPTPLDTHTHRDSEITNPCLRLCFPNNTIISQSLLHNHSLSLCICTQRKELTQTKQLYLYYCIQYVKFKLRLWRIRRVYFPVSLLIILTSGEVKLQLLMHAFRLLFHRVQWFSKTLFSVFLIKDNNVSFT